MKNPEDIGNSYILEITDVFEVSLNETYFEITEKKVKYDPRKNKRCFN